MAPKELDGELTLTQTVSVPPLSRFFKRPKNKTTQQLESKKIKDFSSATALKQANNNASSAASVDEAASAACEEEEDADHTLGTC